MNSASNRGMRVIPSAVRQIVLLLACVVLAVGCAGPQLKKGELPRSISLVEEPSADTASPEVRAFYAQTLEEQLFTTGRLFVKGPGMTLRWRVVEADRGSRALRYLVGFGAGQGRFRVLVTLVDEKKQVIATKEFRGTQTMGTFGGGFNGAVRDAADHTAFFVEDTVYGR
jgi:hypothetical protein